MNTSYIQSKRKLILYIKKKKANWICHILHMDCLSGALLKEGKIEGRSDGKMRKR
jgi:hypothetical protein